VNICGKHGISGASVGMVSISTLTPKSRAKMSMPHMKKVRCLKCLRQNVSTNTTGREMIFLTLVQLYGGISMLGAS